MDIRCKNRRCKGNVDIDLNSCVASIRYTSTSSLVLMTKVSGNCLDCGEDHTYEIEQLVKPNR